MLNETTRAQICIDQEQGIHQLNCEKLANATWFDYCFIKAYESTKTELIDTINQSKTISKLFNSTFTSRIDTNSSNVSNLEFM